MIITIIATLIILYSCFNFKKGFCLYMIFEIFWFPSAKFINLTGLPSIPIYLVTSMLFMLIYLIKGRYKQKCVKYPLFVPYLLLSISHFMSCFTSLAGFFDEFSRTLGFVFYSFLEIWILWKTIDDEKDFRYLIKWFTIAGLLCSLYGFFEYATKTNIVIDYKSTLTPQGIATYLEDKFRGYRMMSFFEHPIGAGINFGLIFVLIFLAYYYYGSMKKNKYLSYFVAALAALCIMLTKMRAGLVFTIIASLSFVNFKKRKFYILILTAILVVVLAFPLYKDHLNIFLSLFNSTAQQAVGGSSVTMRLTQFHTMERILSLSPLTGLGDQFSNYLSISYLTNAYGFESIWFEAMGKYGIIGVVGNIILLVYSVIYIPYKYKCKEACFIALAYWITYTLTSLPFVRMNLFYFVYFYCIKNTSKYESQKELLLKGNLTNNYKGAHFLDIRG